MANDKYIRRRTPEYRIWVQMRLRCNCPTAIQYGFYGGAGIRVCREWDDFEAFMRDMGPRPSPNHTVGRKCSNLEYSPENCYWKQVRHEGVGTSEYRAWASIKTRCFNSRCPAYKNYGARGIKMCDQWRDSFRAFLFDVGPKPSEFHSIDRIDNDGDYEPGNVKWSTWGEQQKNRRRFKFINRSSKWWGVIRNKKHDRSGDGEWFAYFKKHYIGTFRDEVDAATAFNFYAYEVLGDKAAFNLPTGAQVAIPE